MTSPEMIRQKEIALFLMAGIVGFLSFLMFLFLSDGSLAVGLLGGWIGFMGGLLLGFFGAWDADGDMGGPL